jgi:antirestriction protein ArdC
MSKADVAQIVTDKILNLLERGNLPAFKKMWAERGSGCNYSTGKPYQGLNSLLTALATSELGYEHNAWLTVNQANKLGGKVRKGTTGKTVWLNSYRFVPKKGENGEDLSYPLLTSFAVYNVAEIEGIDFTFGTDRPAPLDLVEAANRIGVEVRWGGDKAAYSRGLDLIKLPLASDFDNSEALFAVFAHELVHATGHKSRLNRTFGERFGDPDYAKEELVAELGAAMLCAQFGVESAIEGHAGYLADWLTVLKSDKRFIFKASSAAAKAVALLMGNNEETEENAS